MYVHNSMSYLRDSIFFLIYCDVTSFLNTPKDLEETPLINVIFTMTLHQWKNVLHLWHLCFTHHFPGTQLFHKLVFTCTWTKNMIYYITNNIPISISYMITPRLHQSHAGPQPVCKNTSGAMQSGVPTVLYARARLFFFQLSARLLLSIGLEAVTQ